MSTLLLFIFLCGGKRAKKGEEKVLARRDVRERVRVVRLRVARIGDRESTPWRIFHEGCIVVSALRHMALCGREGNEDNVSLSLSLSSSGRAHPNAEAKVVAKKEKKKGKLHSAREHACSWVLKSRRASFRPLWMLTQHAYLCCSVFSRVDLSLQCTRTPRLGSCHVRMSQSSEQNSGLCLCLRQTRVTNLSYERSVKRAPNFLYDFFTVIKSGVSVGGRSVQYFFSGCGSLPKKNCICTQKKIG